MIAVYKLNGKILKTTNLEKKLSKLKSEPEILYKQETGTEADLDKWIQDNLKEKNDDIKAYVVNKGMKELTFHLGDLTDDEREIILKGCLINYNRR